MCNKSVRFYDYDKGLVLFICPYWTENICIYVLLWLSTFTATPKLDLLFLDILEMFLMSRFYVKFCLLDHQCGLFACLWRSMDLLSCRSTCLSLPNQIYCNFDILESSSMSRHYELCLLQHHCGVFAWLWRLMHFLSYRSMSSNPTKIYCHLDFLESVFICQGVAIYFAYFTISVGSLHGSGG